MANVSASRWSPRLSTAAPARPVGPSMTMSSPRASIRAPSARRPVDDPGDPVGFLVTQLARAADHGPPARLGRGEAQDRDLVDRGGGLRGAELDRPKVRRCDDEVGDRLTLGPRVADRRLVDRRRPSAAGGRSRRAASG